MSLKDEFRESAMVENGLTTMEKYEQIGDDFAIGFLSSVMDYERENGSRICFDERSPKELLNIYKKEKGL